MTLDPPSVVLTMYSREGCHLCDVMEDELRGLLAGSRVALQIIDVDTDLVLQDKFGEWVPVLTAGDLELCHYHLKHDRVREYLSQFS